MKNLVVLGATGSIGASTLDVVAAHRGRYRVLALSAHGSADALFELCRVHRPRLAVLSGVAEDRRTRARFAELDTDLLFGDAALEAVATHTDCDAVMAAIVGGAGLRSTLAAAAAGKRVLLANKEALVMAGPLVVRAARESGAQLLPVDSEHNAVFQCLSDVKLVQRIILTASGGETFAQIKQTWGTNNALSIDRKHIKSGTLTVKRNDVAMTLTSGYTVNSSGLITFVSPASLTASAKDDAQRATANAPSLRTTVLKLPAFATLLLWLPWALGLAVAGFRLAVQWHHLRRWSRASYEVENQLEHTEDRYEVSLQGEIIASEHHRRSPAARWYTPAQVLKLLEEAGFTQVRLLGEQSDKEPIFTVAGRKS